MKFTTPAEIRQSDKLITFDDGIMMLGSCFSDSIADRMKAAGLNVCANPFGTLYNPESIAAALERLESANPFSSGDCIEMGAGAGKICSFSHHTSFARATAADFLENANTVLAGAAQAWKQCKWLIVTIGTAMVWRLRENGCAVTNCLKRPATEFTHEILSVAQIESTLRRILAIATGKNVIFTVSPVRHPGEGMHNNSLSKASLLLGIDRALLHADGATYFPAFEILLDELRDYRFYADDLCHPSKMAADYIWERFCDCFLSAADKEKARLGMKRALHRPLQ